MTDPRAAKRNHCDDLMNKANVQGVGVGKKTRGFVETDQEAVVVAVSRKIERDKLDPADVVPDQIDGVPTDVIEVGVIGKQVVLSQRSRGYHRDRAKGIAPGDSCGHPEVTAGTIGCLVTDGRDHYLLSNNHVLALENEATIGDPVLAPGPYDGGQVGRDQVGVLSQFIPIRFNARNNVDAAIAAVNAREVDRAIRWLGVPRGRREKPLTVGDHLQKYGRTTDYTRGRVIATEVDVRVRYDAGIAMFVDQILANDMSDGGDSGSLALDDDGAAAALLYAGSSRVTVFNPIGDVLGALRVEL